MLRAIASISLIFIFLYNSGLYFFVFKTHQYLISLEIKEELKKKNLSDNDVILIKVNSSSKEISWVSDDEFIYNNKLFDLLKKKEVNGELYLYSELDEREGELLESLKDFAENFIADNGKTKTNGFSFLKDFQKDNIIEEYYSLQMVIVFSDLAFTDSYQFLYNSVCTQLTSPPPKYTFIV